MREHCCNCLPKNCTRKYWLTDANFKRSCTFSWVQNFWTQIHISTPYEEQVKTTEVQFKTIEVGFKTAELHFKITEMHFKTTEERIKKTEHQFKKDDLQFKKAEVQFKT